MGGRTTAARRAVLLAVGLWVVGEVCLSLAWAADPVEVLSVSSDSVSLAWRPVSADVKAWDPQLMPYPAPNSYLPGQNGYPLIVEGPSETPKYVQSFTYQSLVHGHPVSAALAFATWGYRVSWFRQDAKGFVYQGSFLVPALWVKCGPDKYREVSEGRYRLAVPPRGAGLLPDTPYRIVVEPLKVKVHDWLDFEDGGVFIPSFSPLLPSDVSFVALPVLWAEGPAWYYGLGRLSDCSAFAEPQVSYADDMPPLAFNTPPGSRDRYHYEGSDLPHLGQPWDDPWTSRVYWWYGQPSHRGNGRGGAYWYPVCGTAGYVKKGDPWKTFGAIGPRVGLELSVRTGREPLRVVDTSPSTGQRGVSPTVRVDITYSLELTGLNVGALRWQDSSGRAVDFGAQIDHTHLLVWPHKPLSADTDYRLVVGRGAVSAGGVRPDGDFVLTFSTKPASGGGGGGGHGRAQ